MLAGISVSLVTVCINLGLEEVVVALVGWVGKGTESEQQVATMNKAFAAQFCNTALLILFVNANLDEHEPREILHYFDGPFYDYHPEWYKDVG